MKGLFMFAFGLCGVSCALAQNLMTMTAQRVTWLYDLMNSAYDADIILEQSRKMKHVPILNPHPRRAGKVFAHLVFGLLALTVDQLLKLAG
jgi:hypothetical protein